MALLLIPQFLVEGVCSFVYFHLFWGLSHGPSSGDLGYLTPISTALAVACFRDQMQGFDTGGFAGLLKGLLKGWDAYNKMRNLSWTTIDPSSY